MLLLALPSGLIPLELESSGRVLLFWGSQLQAMGDAEGFDVKAEETMDNGWKP